jgi:BirA family transcriptional regulator, biotin operon repressor / biotin---[acetyl-CoA-carboxylase] ligase
MSTNSFIEKTKKYFENKNVDFIKKYYVFDTVDSTNSKAKKIAEKEGIDKSLIIAYTQQCGRGRFSRPWESPAGGLYCSLLLKPDISADKATLLPLVAAIAIAKTLREYKISSLIKWPNDVRVNNKKISGILLESNICKNKIEYVIIGIGVNLNISLDQFSSKLTTAKTSVQLQLGKKINYYGFLYSLLTYFEKYYAIFINGEYETICAEWKVLSDTLGRTVKIVTSSGYIVGKAVDIDESGFLIVETNTGQQKKIMSGDCLYFSE